MYSRDNDEAQLYEFKLKMKNFKKGKKIVAEYINKFMTL